MVGWADNGLIAYAFTYVLSFYLTATGHSSMYRLCSLGSQNCGFESHKGMDVWYVFILQLCCPVFR
jgi:hypothetical protein